MSGNEIEVKLKIADMDLARASLRAAGAKLWKTRFFEDNFLLDDPSHTLRDQRKLLRVRIVKSDSHAETETAILTYKGVPEIVEGVKKREEIECSFQSSKELLEILKRLGYAIIFRYQKFRALHQIPKMPVTICLDETPIGDYFEIEGELEAIHKCAQMLGYTQEDYVADSYASLYFRWCQEKGQLPTEMVFQESSEYSESLSDKRK